jgi:release factor glutamine methyltransferase
VRKIAALFAERGFEQPRLDAELLLAAVLDLRRLDLYLQHERPVDAAELEQVRTAVRRRLRREPLQYIAGVASFRELELAVDARVLIPRPETEVLVGAVLEWAAARADEQLTALDVGTGSGAIALALAHEGRFAAIVATDVSADALAVAAANAARCGLDGRVEFRSGHVWMPIEPAERFDVIVANPPYISDAERAALPPEVAQWEPAAALFGGPDGREILRELVTGAAARLRQGGLLALEVGVTQAAAIAADVIQTGSFEEPRVVPDLTGRPRIVLAVSRAAEEIS